jgi:hypothetical protein
VVANTAKDVGLAQLVIAVERDKRADDRGADRAPRTGMTMEQRITSSEAFESLF